MKIQRSCCNALIGTEQEQINQLYEIVKALAGKYFEGFELMGTYNENTNYDKKYMLVFYNGGTYVKTVDGDSINFAPDLHPDKWALFTYPAQGERGPKGEGATVAELAEKIEGSETIVIDENEAGTALEVHLDAEVVNKIDRAILTPTSAPVADRIPYIDFISNAVKYANLGANIQVDSRNNLFCFPEEVLSYQKIFKFIANEGNDVIYAFMMSPTADNIIKTTSDTNFNDLISGNILQGIYIENVDTETEKITPTTITISKSGNTIIIDNSLSGVSGFDWKYGKSFVFETDNYTLLNFFEFTQPIKIKYDK